MLMSEIDNQELCAQIVEIVKITSKCFTKMIIPKIPRCQQISAKIHFCWNFAPFPINVLANPITKSLNLIFIFM